MTGDFQTVPVQKSDFESKYWYSANFNPYGNPYDGDCMVRAVSAALMMKYKAVCKKLGLGLKIGFGARTDGVSAAKVADAFTGYLEFADTSRYGTVSVEKFIDRCGKTPDLPYGIYVALVPDHAVYICAVSPSKKYFIDTWDSGNRPVSGVFRVLKQVRSGETDHLTLPEFRRTQEIFNDPVVQEKYRKLAQT